jgi:hypothetical protein
LKRELRNLARDFADQLVEVLDRYGMWDAPEEDDQDLASKRVRRSLDTLHEVGDHILASLSDHGEQIAISDIAAELGLTPRDIAHPIALLVSEGKVIKSGTRRGTRYQVARRRTKRPPSMAPPRKTPAKKVRAKKRGARATQPKTAKTRGRKR